MDSGRQSTSDLGSPSPRPSPVVASWNTAAASPGRARAPPPTSETPVPEEPSSDFDAQDFVPKPDPPSPSLNSKMGGEATIHDRAAREGRRNTVRLFRFLAKMMIPTAIIAVLMFAIFALLSWSIPHVLCESSAMALSGSSIGIYECIYVSDGDYSHVTPSKIFWVLIWCF